MKTLLVILIILFSNVSYSNDYFSALELFNKRKVNESVKLFQNVAKDEKNPKRSDAMYNLAIIFDNGFGTSVNKTRALFYYEAAAELSNMYAQYNLGWKYYNGENVNKDVIRAFQLYKAASDTGHPQAMYNLANMYYSGIGTVKNLKQAYKMFLNAKIRGINESNFFLDKITKEITPQELIVLTEEFSSLIEEKIPLPVVVEDEKSID
ncbi:MAG: Beta-lactamase HcpA [Alphaproteobacteria bacterium MarineAlpha8_Bin1]|nr:MAG: Beta-lactamase HcpA [Alphaproteobacteria bacterium MarineAlpha8_Bin1]